MHLFQEEIKKFYNQANWSELGHYSKLESLANDILLFSCPNTLNVGIGKIITERLKSAYRIGVQSESSVAYLYTSPPDQSVKRLLYGRLVQDGRIEGLYCRNSRPNLMFTASAINYWDDRRDNSSNLQLSLCRNTPGMVLDCSYTSDNQIFGINGLAQISKQIAVGGEVFYTQKEKSGGISIGTRLSTMTKNHLRSIATFVCNPIMGHFSFSFGADVSKNMKMATRYDFNMYSYDSDLSFGVEYAPENSKQVLKGRISFSNGLGLSLSGMFQQILYTIGMETSFGPNPAQNFGIEIEIF